jgi:MFS family permease
MHDNKEEESHVEKAFPVTRATYAYALGAALNSCNLGYDIGVSTNAGPLIATDFQLTSLQLELFLGSLNFWTIFGALSSPCMTDRYGRTTTFVMAAMGFLVGIAVMIVSSSFESLMVGRMIVGVAVGVGEAVDPMYIAEISPKHVRGRLVSWAEAGVALGVVLGFSSSLVFYAVENVATKWRCMVGAGMILPIIMVLMVAFGFLPESPQWLISQNQESAARVVLERIYPSDAIDDVVDDIQSSIELERQSSNAVGWSELRALLHFVGTPNSYSFSFQLRRHICSISCREKNADGWNWNGNHSTGCGNRRCHVLPHVRYQRIGHCDRVGRSRSADGSGTRETGLCICRSQSI